MTTQESELIEDDVTIGLTIEEARLVAKSIGITLDQLLKKQARLTENTPQWREARQEYVVMDDVNAQLREVMGDYMRAQA